MGYVYAIYCGLCHECGKPNRHFSEIHHEAPDINCFRNVFERQLEVYSWLYHDTISFYLVERSKMEGAEEPLVSNPMIVSEQSLVTSHQHNTALKIDIALKTCFDELIALSSISLQGFNSIALFVA